MPQRGELPGHRDHRALLGVRATPLGQGEAPAAQVGLRTERLENVLSAQVPFPGSRAPVAHRSSVPQITRMSKPAFDFTGLSVEERLDLIARLWDSLEEAPPLGPDQRAELEHRSREVDANPEEGTDAADAGADIRSRLR